MTYDPLNINQLNRTEPTYLAAYGLTEAPFSLQQNDRFYYLNPALKEQLALLQHYTQYGNLLLLITGERGIGKSSLKQRFINTAQEEWRVCEIQAHTMMDASVLLRQIAQGFGITEPPFDASSLYEVLSEQLEYLHQQSYEPILIIDDAHELPQDALQSLLYLAEHHSDHDSALRIILFCEPQIETMLEDPAIHSLKERITHSIDIAKLDEAETAEYLRHRLAVAGLDGTSPFTPKLINKIYKASGGIPYKINEYAHQNLLDDREPVVDDEQEHDDALIHSESQFTLRNMILGGIALTVVIAVLLFQDDINRVFEEPGPVKTIATETKAIPPATEITTPQAAVSPPAAKQKTIEFSLNSPDAAQQAENSKPVETIKPVTENHQEPAKESPAPAAATLKLDSINPDPVPPSQQRQIIAISGTGFHKRQQVKITWSGNEKILAPSQVNVTSDSYMNLILNVGSKKDSWTVTVIDPLLKITSNTLRFEVATAEKEKSIAVKNAVTAITKAEPAKAVYASIFGTDWIKQQNKDHFTLQLLGTHQKNTLPAYLEKYNLKNEAAMFITKRDNQDWYTLIYDHYPTKTAAQTAAKNLPAGMNKPWVRSFASILPALKTQSPVKPTAAKIVNKPAAAIPVTTIPADQEGWLWSQDPRHYTLQLAAGTNKKAIINFINRYNLKGKAVYFHRQRDSKDWYILVYGSFTGYTSAKEAIKQLPAEVQKAKPWPRPFSAIHAELN